MIEAILKIRTPTKQHCSSETQTTDQGNLSGVGNGLKERRNSVVEKRKEENLKPPDPSQPSPGRRGRPSKLKKVKIEEDYQIRFLKKIYLFLIYKKVMVTLFFSIRTLFLIPIKNVLLYHERDALYRSHGGIGRNHSPDGKK